MSKRKPDPLVQTVLSNRIGPFRPRRIADLEAALRDIRAAVYTRNRGGDRLRIVVRDICNRALGIEE